MKTRDEIIKLLEDVYDLPTRGRCKLTPRTIIDPDKSVKWNIEEVARINSEIDMENKLLLDKHRDELRIVLMYVFDYISDQLDEENPSLYVLKYIYDNAYQDGHSEGVREVFSYLDHYIEFVNDLDKLRRYGEAVRSTGEAAGPCPVYVTF